MGQWSRDEIESAFQHHEQVVVEIGMTWDWSRFADEFTEDATYVEHVYGTFHGRENIRDWIVSTMNTFPGSEMPHFPTSWHAIDDASHGAGSGDAERGNSSYHAEQPASDRSTHTGEVASNTTASARHRCVRAIAASAVRSVLVRASMPPRRRWAHANRLSVSGVARSARLTTSSTRRAPSSASMRTS